MSDLLAKIRTAYRVGCTDHSCVWGHPGGMGTGGGCKCLHGMKWPDAAKAGAALRAMRAALVTAEAREAKLRAGIIAVASLIDDSQGVAGLHHNGDVAEWEELLAGGRFEAWLGDFSAACDLLSEGDAEGKP